MRLARFVMLLLAPSVVACGNGTPENPADAGQPDADLAGPDAISPADASEIPPDAEKPQIDAPVAGVDAMVDAEPPIDELGCASEQVAAWTGTGARDNDIGYPDHILATVTWNLVGSSGCVDTYRPTGTAHYGYAIPGALCDQSIDPEDWPVVAGDGLLIVDRNVSPASYSGNGATYWTVTFTCEYPSGPPDTFDFTGGAAWFDASGVVHGDGHISGEYTLQFDEVACGPEGIPPCTYTWDFAPVP